jgi:hypothetical protein
LPYFLEGAPVYPAELPKLRIMRECMSRYFISLGLAKESPYTTAFNEVVVRLIESGIVQHWRENIVYQRVDPAMSSLFEEDGRITRGPEVLRLEYVQGAFMLLGAGMLLCVLVFIGELSLEWMGQNRN